ncbi:M15 family metallopeptidase [Paenibacillus tengchongensis]|uniref:M15 family metallopeptidase n=1 Tax=Paenibacillus tengchongensis TaxID=2608684 RepID=UPI001C9E8E8A|nr:M15 family metallopeptidase [Paenibacillus tengchongensis]
MLRRRQVGIRAMAALLAVIWGLGSLSPSAEGSAANAASGGQQPATAADATMIKKNNLPKGFVYLDEVIPAAQFEIRYYTANNFVGARIDGYKAPLAIFSKEAAAALKKVSDDLAQKGYILHIYDAYRPQKAVNHFLRWSQDASDVKTKQQYYPRLDKRNLFKLGFIAKKSGHSRGSTVDLTLADKKTGELVDMGSPFDFFGEISYYNTTLVSARQHANRKVLKDAMEKRGFKYYSKEWWHFTLMKEPYPSTYFNFNVE